MSRHSAQRTIVKLLPLLLAALCVLVIGVGAQQWLIARIESGWEIRRHTASALPGPHARSGA